MNRLSGLGLATLAFALLGIFVWIPLDIETGYLEKVRRSVTLGDSLAPAVAFSLLGLGGLLLIVERAFSNRGLASPFSKHTTSRRTHVLFALKLFIILAVFISVLRFAGPLITTIAGLDTPYRLLRDTAPWKYTGFVLAGVLLTSALSMWTTGQFKIRYVLAGFVVCMLIIALYDLPFEDLLLPPNGDV